MIAQIPRPYVFVHIPRTAGSSMESVLLPQACVGYESLGFYDIPPEVRRDHWTDPDAHRMHCGIDQLRSHMNTDWMFKWTFVRNPWDRVASLARWQAGTQLEYWSETQSIKERIRKVCTCNEDPEARDAFIAGQTQMNYICIGDRVCVDYVGKYETLNADWATVCREIGLKHVELPMTKNTATQNYKAFYDAESAGWVAKRYANEIDYFGYKFDP